VSGCNCTTCTKKCRKQPWTGHFLRVWVSDCYYFTRSRIVQKLKVNPISYRNSLVVGSCLPVSDYWSDLQLPIFCCLVEFSIWFSIKYLVLGSYENLAVWNGWEDRTEKNKKSGGRYRAKKCEWRRTHAVLASTWWVAGYVNQPPVRYL